MLKGRKKTTGCLPFKNLYHLQFDTQPVQQQGELLQVFEALLGQLSDGCLLLGEGCQQWRQLLQIPLLFYVLVQCLQLESAVKGS